MTQLIKTASLTGFYELVTRLNGNPDALLRQFNIEAEKVKNLDGVLPFNSATNLIEETARQLNCPDFGLRLAQQQDLTILGPLAAVAMNAPTVGDALKAIIGYLHYFTRGLHMVLDAEGADKSSRLWFEPAHGLPALRQSQELTLGVAHISLKMLYGEGFRPQAVLLQSDAPLHDSYREFFAAPIHFSQDRDALLLSTEQLEKSGTERSAHARVPERIHP
ncbi:AraC family transcriptional regulator [Microbulbifer taiwanensis]|uniref:AraC family transcriptional regulator n=1 Tax=Microbulbifer taiwanensis TaxID=986746 RepID=UPI0036070AA5